MARTVLFFRVRAQSERVPFKAMRLMGGKPMFLVCLERLRHYCHFDAECAAVPPNPADDLLAWALGREGVAVFRENQRGPWIPAETVTVEAGFQPDDVVVFAGGDEPFLYCEDLRHRVDSLKASDCNMAVSAPTGGFPIRDWEWAVGPQMWIAKASLSFMGLHAINQIGSPARQGAGPEAYRLLIRIGLLKVLLVEKPLPAREPWPWQPLWVDEPGQFGKAKLIYENLEEAVPSDRHIRQFLEHHPEMATWGANAMRRTSKVFYEDEEMVGLLRGIMARDGAIPALGDGR